MMKWFRKEVKRRIQNGFSRMGYTISKNAPADSLEVQQFWLREVAKPVIFDVGSNDGDTCIKYAKAFPNATIYGFEPFPEMFRTLQRNCSDYPQIKGYSHAISSSNGTSQFHSNLSHYTNSLLPTVSSDENQWNTTSMNTIDIIEVTTRTLDDFCDEHAISHIDLLKMDIQGGEYEALLGAKRLLEGQKISLIYSEIILAEGSYQGQHAFHEYLSLMDSLGYQLLDIYNPIRRRSFLMQIDVIFLPKKTIQESRILTT